MITFDVRLVKFFRMGSERSFQITCEIFNLFNRLNKGQNFDTTFESPNFGGWSRGLDTNQLQIQLGARFEF